MFRTVSAFRTDLEHYYEMGFRPVLASEYLSNTMKLPPGASPIVLTFDDATPSQIQLAADGSVKPNCAVGIWQEFAKTHPDFPVHATFFVLPDVLWGPKKIDLRKVKLVFDLGSELANHTINHPKLSHLTDEKVKWELGTATERLEELGQKPPHSMALPFGISPKNKKLLRGFDWNGRHINFTGVFLVGANPAPAPTDPKFNRFRVPRIMAVSKPYGIDYWLNELKKGHVKPYVQP
jgi:peptidoglycan/xylan/chitin deacetylase (PgdA/CDA1 family)